MIKLARFLACAALAVQSGAVLARFPAKTIRDAGIEPD